MNNKLVLDANVIENLQSLADETDPDFMIDLLQYYLQFAPKTLTGLEHAHALSDAQQLADLAHTLKGASSNIGAWEMTDLCKALEKHGRNQQLQEAGKLMPLLRQAFGNVKSEIETVLRQTTPAILSQQTV